MAATLSVFWGMSVVDSGYIWSWIIKPAKGSYEISNQTSIFVDKEKAVEAATELVKKDGGGVVSIYSQGGRFLDSIQV